MLASWSELLWANRADGTAVDTTASEASLLTGLNQQPVLPAFFFDGPQKIGKTISIKAGGVFSNTGTPTLIFQARLGTTAGASYLSGGSVGVTAAITTANGVTNKWWELDLDLTLRTPGIGTGNSTLSGAGKVSSPSGFASPFVYPIEITTPDTATWTQTFDAGLTQYFNLSVTWSASSASNTITLKKLLAWAWN